ncbi:hypothetical protein LCGC14_1003990 [marine sediment metagenome]|uniref:Uncharacterized protein n=2 Tax=root TaxID=1 RepID=A0A831QM91_9FLAO|nr:hypothetical protein [Pricia antarctica]
MGLSMYIIMSFPVQVETHVNIKGTIHSNNAIITRLDEFGKAESHTLEAEYIPIGLSPKEDFYEKELKRIISQYGNTEQVWSAFEIRKEPNTPSILKD